MKKRTGSQPEFFHCFNSMNKFSRAFNIIKSTPLEYDCGTLCGSKCCTNEAGIGMLLFPGEEELFEGSFDSWYLVIDSDLVLKNGKRMKLLVCKGECEREKRPLSCRIFPLMPYLTGDGFLELRSDPRGAGLCPLIQDTEKFKIQKHFIDEIYDAFEDLIDDEEVIEFIEYLTKEYKRIEKMIR